MPTKKDQEDVKEGLLRKSSSSESLYPPSPNDLSEHNDFQKPTPLPMRQLTALMIGQLPEPIVATVLFPFVNKLVAEVGPIGGDVKKVGYYAGFIESLFFLAEFTMILRWGRLSDRIGRKPVILCGLFGLVLSSSFFGLSKTFYGLIISRALAGLLSGNISVMKSALGEITDESNMAEGFAFLPLVWAVGTTIGPLIGGYTASPHEKFPTIFTSNFWIKYPYFLPCFSASVVCFGCALVIAIFFEESLPALRKQKVFQDNEYQSLEPGLPGRIDRHQRSSSEETARTLVDEPPVRPKQKSIWEALTYKVVVSVGNYGAIALLDIAFVALMPLFLSTKAEAGGLGYSPSKIGLVMGSLGLGNGIIQGFVSAKVQRYFGVKKVYVYGILCYAGVFGIFPITNALARQGHGDWAIFPLIGLQLSLNICGNMSFGSVFIFITAAAEKSELGTTNGIAQTMASLMRMMGPASVTSLFALTMEKDLLGGKFVYLVLIGLTGLATFAGTFLPEKAMGNL